MIDIRVKKSFTLIELIIVILLISTTYFLVFSNSNFTIKKEKTKISLLNLKEYLLDNFKFEDELSFICVEDSFDCFIKIDNEILKDFKVENFFNTKPEIYEYNQNQTRIDFEDVRISDISYDIIFELKINSDYKSNDFIVDSLEDKIFVFNSIFKKSKLYSSMNDVLEEFNTNQLEVRDAF